MNLTNAKEPLKVIRRPIEKVNFTPIAFTNNENGLKLAGILFTPKDFDDTKKYPAAIVAGTQEFHIVKDASHFEMYDGEPYVLENIDVICNFLTNI